MAITATQTNVLIDLDGDGIADPGEIITTTVVIQNTGPEDATGLQFTENLNGMTLVNQAGEDINVSPIAFDESYEAVGNTVLQVGGTAGAGPELFVSGGSATANDVEFFGQTFQVLSFQSTSAQGGILWRNSDTGQAVAWLLDGAGGFAGTSYGGANASWHIVNDPTQIA